ncbi:MAG: NAD(P)/FAD-dependent oxidoreductase, partial [Candidatus Asgardarchaeia archaeon]
MATYLIIGNGIAGFSAALRLRKLRKNAEIYIFTKEKYPIYDKRDLPFFISGKVDEDYILLTDLDFYEENNINIIFGTVTFIDTDNYEIRLSDGEYYGYDKLIIASGSKPISKINQKIFQLPTYYLKTMDDAKSIKSALKTANNVVIIGGNQSSFTLAAELVDINKNVSLIIRKGNMTWNLFDDFSKIVISKLFSYLGVNFYPDVEISNVDRKKKSIKLSSGKQIPADIVIIDENFTPNIDFLRKSKIKVGEGIIVDHYFMTNVEDVYAIGDVAEVYDVIYGKNMPHQGWEIAKEQGELVAYNIVEPACEYMGTVTAIGFTIGKYN